MSSLLEVAGVNKRFGGLMAVDDMGFSIDDGEVVGLLGPNGSGKTTLMNLISGALRVTSGRIAMRDRALSEMPAHRIAHEGIARG